MKPYYVILLLILLFPSRGLYAVPNIRTMSDSLESNIEQMDSIHSDTLSKKNLVLGTKKEEYQKKNFPLFPNPANKSVLLLNKSYSKLESIQLYDYFGRVINCQYTLSDGESTIDTQPLATGIYFLNIITEYDRNTRTLIIVH